MGQKRNSIATKKYFKAPFGPVIYRQHHKSKWWLSSETSDAAKAKFFDVVPVINQMSSHFEGSDGQLHYTINTKNIDVLISEVLFDPKDGKESLAHATSVFKGGNGTVAYCVHIKQIKIFWIVIHYISFGSSFRLVLMQVAAAREESKLG